MLRPLILALALAGPAPAQEAMPDAAELAAALAAFDVPGAAMATLEGCAPGPTIVAGTADLGSGSGTGAPVTADTAFEAASLTKPVFAVIVMQLVAEGTLDLDRPLAADGFAYPRIADADRYAALTPRMILTHRTGLPNWVDSVSPLAERVAPIPFEAEPGTAFGYSGEGFQLLQAYVEHVEGVPLAALFEARLGAVMPRSVLTGPLPEGVAPARGYESAAAGGPGRGLEVLDDAAMAASSLVTTAGDYAAFLGHVCRGAGLPPDLWAEMLRAQSPAPPETIRVGADGPPPPPASWGLGWTIFDLGDATLAGHGGNNGAFTAFGGFLRETGEGLVILTNGANGEALIQALLLPGG